MLDNPFLKTYSENTKNISNMMIENTKKNLKNIIKHYFDENIFNSKNFTYIKFFKIYDNEIDYKRFKG